MPSITRNAVVAALTGQCAIDDATSLNTFQLAHLLTSPREAMAMVMHLKKRAKADLKDLVMFERHSGAHSKFDPRKDYFTYRWRLPRSH